MVLDTDYYPVTLVFQDGLTVRAGRTEDYTFGVRLTVALLVDILRGRVSVLGALLRGQLTVEGLWRHLRGVYRFYRLLSQLARG